MAQRKLKVETFFKSSEASKVLLSAWEDLSQSKERVEEAQHLFEQILGRSNTNTNILPLHPSTGSSSHELSHSCSSSQEKKIWALVAFVATSISFQFPTEEEKEIKKTSQQHAKWHLIELLSEAKLSLSLFLNSFSSLFDRLLLKPELLEMSTHLKEEFTIATVLYQKYSTFWKTLSPPGSTNKQPILYEAGWVLFLIAKRQLKIVGLGELYYLLLAVLSMVLSQVVASGVGASVEAEVAAALSALGSLPSNEQASSSKMKIQQDLLHQLCANPRVQLQDVVDASKSLQQVIFHLTQMQVLTTTEASIWSEQVLKENVHKMNFFYTEHYLLTHESFDERFYLNEKQAQIILGHLTTTPNQSQNQHQNQNGVGIKRPHDSNTNTNTSSSPIKTSFTMTQAWQWHGSASPPLLPRASVHRTNGSHTPPPPPPPLPLVSSSGDTSSSSSGTNGASGRSVPIPTAPRTTFYSPSVHSSHPHQTPVTAAVETRNWIRETLTQVSSTQDDENSWISSTLHDLFNNCSKTRKRHKSEQEVEEEEEEDDAEQEDKQMSRPLERIQQTLDLLCQRLIDSKNSTTSVKPMLFPSLITDHLTTTKTEMDETLQKTLRLSKRLFYLVLEKLLTAEIQRLHGRQQQQQQQDQVSTRLLNNDVFICSLFTCSLEIVLKAHSLITFSFPFLLDKIQVDVFDFGKLIESFVKWTPKLPLSLKRHMYEIEQTIVNSLAWRSNSKLFTTIQFTQQQQQVSTCRTNTSTNTSSLHVFFRKVLSFVASRIYHLGNVLGLESKYKNQVWTAVKECLSQHMELIRDRYVDQIILCSLYGVCKVNKRRPEITFKQIIDAYKRTTSTNSHRSSSGVHGTASQVIRHIVLTDGQTRGDIIAFYNKCFISSMKLFLLQLQMQQQQEEAAIQITQDMFTSSSQVSTSFTNGTPAADVEIVSEAATQTLEKILQSYHQKQNPSPITKRPPMTSTSTSTTSSSYSLHVPEVESLPISLQHSSPKRVLSSNVYMSPLRQSRLQQQRVLHLTPRTHALYAFGESPSRDLALINRAVNSERPLSGGSSSSGPRRVSLVPTLPRLPVTLMPEEFGTNTSSTPHGEGESPSKRRHVM